MEYRIEHDSLGEVKVAADKLWGAQTQHSLENFKIGIEKFRWKSSMHWSKIKRARGVNHEVGLLDETVTKGILLAADEVLEGKWDDQFSVIRMADRKRHAIQYECERSAGEPEATS